MTLLLVILLVLLWGAVIVPTLLRVRQSPASSVGTFRRNMQALGSRASARSLSRRSSGAGRWILAPAPQSGSRSGSRSAERSDSLGMGPNPVEQRRKVFVGLLAAAGATLVLSFLPTLGVFLKIHLAVDVALVAYVAFLVRLKARRPYREIVSYPEPEREEREYLRVSGSSRGW